MLTWMGAMLSVALRVVASVSSAIVRSMTQRLHAGRASGREVWSVSPSAWWSRMAPNASADLNTFYASGLSRQFFVKPEESDGE